MISLVRQRIEIASLQNDLTRPEDGALVVFEGVVRNHSRGKKVLRLDYEAYEPMALRQLEEIRTLAKERFDVRDIAVVHRLGSLSPGECSIAIVVASSHRAPAFEACRFVIDSIKTSVPIWKKEIYEDGSAWIEGESIL